MKMRLLVLVVLLITAFPAVSHGFGLLRYICDGIANQLGFDRGPIPKAMVMTPGFGCGPQGGQAPAHPDAHRIYIQADGFIGQSSCRR